MLLNATKHQHQSHALNAMSQNKKITEICNTKSCDFFFLFESNAFNMHKYLYYNFCNSFIKYSLETLEVVPILTHKPNVYTAFST